MQQVNAGRLGNATGVGRWFRENWWWPTVLVGLCALFVGLTLIGRSAGPTEVKLKLRAPEHLVVSASTVDYGGTLDNNAGGALAFYVSGLVELRSFEVRNISARDLRVRLEGFEAIPEGLRFAYGVVDDPWEFRRTGKLPPAQEVRSNAAPAAIPIGAGQTVTIGVQLHADGDALFGRSKTATIRVAEVAAP